MSKTDFQAMQTMSERNLDIALCPDIISANKNKKGGDITFGVPLEVISKVIKGLFMGKRTHHAALYIINIEQFESIKKEPYELSEIQKELDSLRKERDQWTKLSLIDIHGKNARLGDWIRFSNTEGHIFEHQLKWSEYNQSVMLGDFTYARLQESAYFQTASPGKKHLDFEIIPEPQNNV